MAVEWSGLSPDILLTLDRTSGVPMRVQLEGQLREAIRAGRLMAGERLPSTRELARDLSLSRGLVQDSYAQLVAEGYLSAQVGSATRVAAVAAGTAHVADEADVAGAPGRLVGQPVPSGPPMIANFEAGVPDLASFPRDDWLWALREANRQMPHAGLDYGDPRGAIGLRTVLAAYLRRVRAAAADPERLVVCSGYQQGLNLVLAALARTGVRRLAFEDPGSVRRTRVAAARAGLDAVPVPVDADGIDVSALARSGARAVIVSPAHQWPTGTVLAPSRRLQLIAWANDHDAAVIEDDYDAEFRYDREPVGALQGLAADRVASIGTVSKSLAPSLRIGWVLCPPALAEAIAEEKRSADRGGPALDQLALARLIESGRYDRHLRRMRVVYARRRAALVDALARHAPEVSLGGLAAGFHALATLPGSESEADVIVAARTRGVGLHGLTPLSSMPPGHPVRLVLGFGNVSERAIEAGIAAVGDLLGGAPTQS